MFLFLTKKTKIGDLKTGTSASIEGEVVARNPLRLPKSGTTCVYYDMLTESYKQGARGKGRRMWLPDRVDRVCNGFIVTDGTGRIWIGCDAESMSVSGGHRENGILDKKGRKRYSASFIKDGDRVRVRGIVEEKVNQPANCSTSLGPGKKGILEIAVRALAS